MTRRVGRIYTVAHALDMNVKSGVTSIVTITH